MKRLIFNFIMPVVALFAMTQTAFAQPIVAPAVRTLSNGGARILSVQGNTAANPAFGFTGNAGFPTNLNDGGGGNGIFRPAANTMAFSTSSLERMRILSTGNIGIGTTTPTTRLNVSTASSNDGIRINQTGNTSATLSLQAATGKNWALFSTGSGNSQGAGHLTFHDWTSNIERMRIASGGNVGIGTTDPLHKLHVASEIMVSGSNPGAGPQLLFSDNAASTAYPNGRWGIEYTSSSAFNQGLNFWQPWNPSTGGGTNWRLFLKDDGKVGIGVDPDPASCSTAPNGPFPAGYRLYVKEGILTERLKIANYCSSQWADYVFAPDYKLKPLSEVEAFVKTNKHLPNVPSAQEIENDGLDVADMLARQMEKIEELTLYMIEMKKEIDILKSENASLKTHSVNR
jgi:hypothetical protein